VDPPHGLEQFDVVMVTDCTDAAIFQITNINTGGASQNIVHNTGGSSPGNATQALGKDYTGAGEIVQLMTSTYYIGTGVSGRPALFRKDGAAAAQELIEGVEDLQVLYGIDTDSNRTPNRYVTADNVTDWGDVVSAEVRLLLQTLDDNLASQANQQYTFNGLPFVSPDRRLRRTFTNTISIRNRTL
ncbi:MAG: PilW family protein, partial [Gammaproteobacteria bacterium]